MQATAYKPTPNGKTYFTWIFINTEGRILRLSGELGKVQEQFLDLGSEFTPDNFETKAIPIVQDLGYVFDFNEKCREILVRFPLANVADLYDFRFDRVEPLIHDVLQRSGNGFCDYGYCDEEYLNMVAWVYSIEKAVEVLEIYLPKVLATNELDFSVWASSGGVPQEKILDFSN